MFQNLQWVPIDLDIKFKFHYKLQTLSKSSLYLVSQLCLSSLNSLWHLAPGPSELSLRHMLPPAWKHVPSHPLLSYHVS